jgi:cell division septation protein DedD
MIGYEVPTSYNTVSIQVINKNAGNLTVAKTVQGEGADIEKEFSFKVTLSDSTIQGTYGSMVFEDGIASFRLKHGESMSAINLPAGISYTVGEEDYGDEGYTSDSTGAVGTIENGIEKKASFINTYTPASAPTETPKPTETPAPTETPKPTESPAPTETPAPSPSASPRPTTPETPYHIDISGFKIPNTAVKN